MVHVSLPTMRPEGHYNYFRDYSPDIGRYVESDPVGLLGGLNSYAYVDSSPLFHLDAFGLAKQNGKWSKCGKMEKQWCEHVCGDQGVKSCRQWWYIGTSVVEGEVVEGWTKAPEPSCNCNECPPVPSTSSSTTKSTSSDLFGDDDGNKKKRSLNFTLPLWMRFAFP